MSIAQDKLDFIDTAKKAMEACVVRLVEQYRAKYRLTYIAPEDVETAKCCAADLVNDLFHEEWAGATRQIEAQDRAEANADHAAASRAYHASLGLLTGRR